MHIYNLLAMAQDSLIEAGIPPSSFCHATIKVDNTLVLPRAYVYSTRGEITVAGWWLQSTSKKEVLRMLRHELGHIIVAGNKAVKEKFRIKKSPPKAVKRWRQVLAFFGVIPYSKVSREEWFCEKVSRLNKDVMAELVNVLRA